MSATGNVHDAGDAIDPSRLRPLLRHRIDGGAKRGKRGRIESAFRLALGGVL
jgi:hypothetical protein